MGGFIYSGKTKEQELAKALRQWQCFVCGGGQNTFVNIVTKDTDTVKLSGDGTVQHPLKADAIGGGTGTGDVTDGANQAGSGIGVFAGKTGSILSFRRILGTAGQIGVALSGGDIILTNLSSGSGAAETMSSVGGGIAIFQPKSGVNFPMKSFINGNNTVVVDNGTTVQINAIGGGSGTGSGGYEGTPDLL